MRCSSHSGVTGAARDSWAGRDRAARGERGAAHRRRVVRRAARHRAGPRRALAALRLPQPRRAPGSRDGRDAGRGAGGLPLYGRYRRSSALSELLLVYAMSLLSLTALFFVTLPDLIGGDVGAARRAAGRPSSSAWSLGPADRSPRRWCRRTRVHQVARPWRELVGVVVRCWSRSGHRACWRWRRSCRTPSPLRCRPRTRDGRRSRVTRSCFALAAGRPCRATRSRPSCSPDVRSRDRRRLLGWFGAACALGGVGARCRLPAVPVALHRLAVRRRPAAARLLRAAPRRRGARDPGLLGGPDRRSRSSPSVAGWPATCTTGSLQELGWIRTDLSPAGRIRRRRSVRPPTGRWTRPRRRSDPVARRPDEPLAIALRRASASRWATATTCRSSWRWTSRSTVPPPVREELVRIAREAVANAARHSGSPTVGSRSPTGGSQVGDDGARLRPGVRVALVVSGSPACANVPMPSERRRLSRPLRGTGRCVEVTW